MIVCASGFQVILRPGSIPFCGIFINYRHDIFMYISFSTEVVLIEALPSEREATYFTLRVFFFISLLRVQGSLCIAITNKVQGGVCCLPPTVEPQSYGTLGKQGCS